MEVVISFGEPPFKPLYNLRKEIYADGVRVQFCSVITHQECMLYYELEVVC